MSTHISAVTELMKNQKQADVMSPAKDFEVLQTNDGLSLFFSVGTDGVFYLSRQVPASDPGWKRHDLSSMLSAFHDGLKVTTKSFAVSDNPRTGKIDLAVAISVGGEDFLYLSIGNSNVGAAWEKGVTWTLIPYDDQHVLAEGLEIADIYIAQSRREQFIAVDIVKDPGTALGFVFRYFIDPTKALTGRCWNAHDLSANLNSSKISSCLGRKSRERVDGIYTLGEIAGRVELLYSPLYNPFNPAMPANPSRFAVPPDARSISSASIDGTNTFLFVAGSDGLYCFAPDDQQDGAKAQALVRSDLFADAVTLHAHATNTTVVVWGLNRQGRIFYTRCDAARITDAAAWSAPVPLIEGVEQIASYLNRVDQGVVIFAHIAERKVVRLSQDPVSRDWESREILLPTTETDDVLEFESYSTHVMLTGDDSLPVAEAEMAITATSVCSVYLNGIYHVLSPDAAVTVKSDATGVLTIVQETDSIGAVCYHLELPGAGGKLDVNPMSKLVAKMEVIRSGTDLGNVKIDNGDGTTQPLIGDTVTHEQRKATAEALQQFIAIAKKMPGDGSSYTAFQNKTPALRASRFAVSDSSIWGVKFQDDHWSYSHGQAAMHAHGLTIDTAADTIALRTSAVALADIGQVLESTGGDIFLWLKHTVEDVGEFFVKEVDGIYHFFIKIGGEYYRFVLDAVRDVIQAIEWVFSKIKVLFADLIKWLGFLFNWDDILRTHLVIKNIINQTLHGSVAQIAMLKSGIITVFSGIEKRIAEFSGLESLGQSVSSVAGGASRIKGQDSPQANWGNHHLKSGMGSASATMSIPEAAGSELISLLNELAAAIEREGELFVAVAKTIKTEIVDKIGTLPAGEIVKRIVGVIGEILAASVENILVTGLDVMEILVQGMIDVMNATIEIPVISWMYRKVAKTDLSILDAACLVGAIPATILYKAATSKAPFPDNAFTSSVIMAGSLDGLSALYGGSPVRSVDAAFAATEIGIGQERSMQALAMGGTDEAKTTRIILHFAATAGSAAFIPATIAKSAAREELRAAPEDAGILERCKRISVLHGCLFFLTTLPIANTAFILRGESWDRVVGRFVYALTAIQKIVDVASYKPSMAGWNDFSKVADCILGVVGLVPTWAPVVSNQDAPTITGAIANTAWNANRILTPFAGPEQPQAFTAKMVCIGAYGVAQAVVAIELITEPDSVGGPARALPA
jgi:hypothetical protein